MLTLPREKICAATLWLLLALLAGGVELGGSLQPSRLLLFFGLAVALAPRLRLKKAAPPAQYFFAVAIIWLIWGTCSLFWSRDIGRGAKEVFGLLLGILTVTSVIYLAAECSNSLQALRRGWMSAFILTLPIAAVELFLDKHMSASIGQEISGDLGSAITYAAATFGNRNTYVAFIGLATPALLWSFSMASNWRSKALASLALIFAGAVIVIDATRLGMLTFVLQLIAWFWLMRSSVRHVHGVRRHSQFLGIAVVLLSLLLSGYLVLRASPYTQLRLALAVSGHDGSVDARRALLKNGMEFAVGSWGMGIGAGSFSPTIETGHASYDTSDGGTIIIDPHNLWVEVISQYGFVIALLFTAWLLYCLRTLVAGLKRCQSDLGQGACRAGTVLLLGLPTNAMINSAYLTFTMFWAAIGTITALSCFAWRSTHLSYSSEKVCG